MTKVDCLIEVVKKLREARTLGEACSDRPLLFFIDMAIVHVCDTLGARQQSQEADEGYPSLALAAL